MSNCGRVLCALCAMIAFAFAAAGQGLEIIQDTNYDPGRFNPGGSGRIQRIRLRDHDVDDDPVILSRVRVENLGSASNDEIEWVRLTLTVDGKRTVLVEGEGFPLMAHLTGPVVERMIPDSGLGYLDVSIGTTTAMVDGNTVRSQVSFWYSEGDYGGSATVPAGHAALFSTEGFLVELLPTTTEGVVNPGDPFTALQFRVADDDATNLNAIYLTDFRVDGPGAPEIVEWLVVVGPDSFGAPTAEISEAGHAELPAGGLFVAPPGGRRVVELRGIVGSEPPDSLDVRPTVSFSLREGPNTQGFSFDAPAAVTVRNAGFEVLENRLLVRPRQVLERVFQEIVHSELYARDEDANATPVTVHSVDVTNRGTAGPLSFVEVWDQANRLLGFAGDWGLIELAQPDGRPVRVPDGGDITLRFVLAMGDGLPLGASVLLCKSLDVEEAHPSLITPTQFRGMQVVCDDQAVFFGEPQVWLKGDATDGDLAESVEVRVGTDGETVKRLQGTLRFDEATRVEVVSVEAAGPYRLVEQHTQVDAASGLGEVRFALELTATSARPGDLLTVTFTHAEAEEAHADPVLPVHVRLENVLLMDTADIELPFALRERELRFELAVPAPPEVDVPVDVPEVEPPVVVAEPPVEHYRIGQVIELRLDNEATVALVAPREDAADRVVGLWRTAYNEQTGAHELDIPTEGLAAGRYELRANGELVKDFELRE